MPEFDESVDVSRRVLAILPETREFAMRNREFLQRMVRFLAAEVAIGSRAVAGLGLLS